MTARKHSIDLNCDMGEGMSTDALILPFISSANIACGFHAGTLEIMRETIAGCIKHNVAIGAHPSWPDREHFGRTEMHTSPQELYNCIQEQLHIIQNEINKAGAVLHHVKPHGALYNQSAKDAVIASTIAKAVYDFNPSLQLYGLSGSVSITAAKQTGLRTAAEVFADRTYQEDGSLTPRSHPNALIEQSEQALQQALGMILNGTVTSINGKPIELEADTICLHGDGSHAVAFAKTISSRLKEEGIDICTLS